MTDKYITPKGEQIDSKKLRVPKARELANALINKKIDFAEFIECRTDKNEDTIVFNVDVEVPQIRKYPINNCERIAAIFLEEDNKFPEVLALRSDFPLVPHLNLRVVELPRSLCLYEGEYRDLKSQWTALRFIEGIRKWLSLTAKGTLHQDDQPLEPLITGFKGNIVLPYDLVDTKRNETKILYITKRIPNEGGNDFFFAEFERPSDKKDLPIISTIHICSPRQHGIISQSPNTLAEIARFVNDSKLDILAELRNYLINYFKSNPRERRFLEYPLMLIIICPKKRQEDKEPESIDIWAFITEDTVKKVGEKIEIWDQRGNHVGVIIRGKIKNGEDVKVDLLNPSFNLTRGLAAKLNSLNKIIDLKITAVGVGALGSQVVMNLARSGIGTWNLIDRDILRPHNVTRHFLTAEYIGYKKSWAIAGIANNMISDENLFDSIPADVMEPGQYKEKIDTALKSTDVILDMSVSVATARYLTLDIDSSARRISLFLNPIGKELVLLAEDSRRSIKLDELEMQLYKAIINNVNLSEHYKLSKGYQRYGRSCRDITTILPQTSIALHAAIGGQALQKVFQSYNSQITVWKSDSFGNVKRIDIPTTTSIRNKVRDWTVVIFKDMLSKLFQLRNKKLPNETGGILIGSFDHDRQIVYIVETIPSPPDSEEWPTLYIRGCEDLRQKVEKISQKTDGGLEYVGEWHSHPDRVSTKPSKDDISVFIWLTELMDKDGLPAVLMIVGDNNHTSCFIREMKCRENLIPYIK